MRAAAARTFSVLVIEGGLEIVEVALGRKLVGLDLTRLRLGLRAVLPQVVHVALWWTMCAPLPRPTSCVSPGPCFSCGRA